MTYYLIGPVTVIRIDRIKGCGCEPSEAIVYLGAEETPSARADVVLRVHLPATEFNLGDQLMVELTPYKP